MNAKILVPIDFTEVTENAILYAIGASKALKTGIVLAHIVEEEAHIKVAQVKLDALISKYAYTRIDMLAYIKTGNIFDGIAESAKELNIGLIMMGTHGLQGIQYVFGSNALKMVTKSDVPFIIVQDRIPANDDIKNIIVPIDMAAESKQILSAVVAAAQIFSAHINLFVAFKNDEFLEHTISNNLSFAKRYLTEHNIAYQSTHAISEDDFESQLIKFADAQNADIIAIVNHHYDGYKNLFGGNFDQNIITNEAKIPVLILNSKDFMVSKSIFRVFQ